MLNHFDPLRCIFEPRNDFLWDQTKGMTQLHLYCESEENNAMLWSHYFAVQESQVALYLASFIYKRENVTLFIK